jgi:hypothetical protein
MDWLPIVISLIALIISIASVLATWKAPQIAARLAEGLRSAASRADLKRWVFMTLMQQRATPFTPEAVQAFNVIDAVFVDAHAVRDRWAVYLNSMDIGLTGVGDSDLARSYSPAYVMRRINIEGMSQAIQEKELQRVFSEASANTTPQAVSTSTR